MDKFKVKSFFYFTSKSPVMNFLLSSVLSHHLDRYVSFDYHYMWSYGHSKPKAGCPYKFFSGLVPFLHTSQSTTSSCLSLVVLGKGPNPTQCWVIPPRGPNIWRKGSARQITQCPNGGCSLMLGCGWRGDHVTVGLVLVSSLNAKVNVATKIIDQSFNVYFKV